MVSTSTNWRWHWSDTSIFWHTCHRPRRPAFSESRSPTHSAFGQRVRKTERGRESSIELMSTVLYEIAPYPAWEKPPHWWLHSKWWRSPTAPQLLSNCECSWSHACVMCRHIRFSCPLLWSIYSTIASAIPLLVFVDKKRCVRLCLCVECVPCSLGALETFGYVRSCASFEKGQAVENPWEFRTIRPNDYRKTIERFGWRVQSNISRSSLSCWSQHRPWKM